MNNNICSFIRYFWLKMNEYVCKKLAFNAVYSKIGRFASDEVVVNL